MKFGIVCNVPDNNIENTIKRFKLLKEAGFDALDLQCFMHTENFLFSLNDDDFVEFLTKVKQAAKEIGLIINQLHSYWAFPPVLDFQQETLDSQLVYYKRAIFGANVLGCKLVVIHHRFPFGFDKTTNDEKSEKFFRINVDFLKKLEPYAKENNVTLCLENLPMNDVQYCTVDGTLKIIDAVNSENVKMCLDIGHANVFGDDIYEDILKINDKLACMHVHDNKHGMDLHLYPWDGTVNWDGVVKGLNEINYQGVFSFETHPSRKLGPQAKLTGYKYLCEIGHDLFNK